MPMDVGDADVASGEAGEDPAAAAFAYLQGLGNAQADEVEELERQERELNRQRTVLKRAIKNKRQRDSRLLDKAAKNLSAEQLMALAAKKVAAKAKAKAVAKAKSRAERDVP